MQAVSVISVVIVLRIIFRIFFLETFLLATNGMKCKVYHRANHMIRNLMMMTDLIELLFSQCHLILPVFRGIEKHPTYKSIEDHLSFIDKCQCNILDALIFFNHVDIFWSCITDKCSNFFANCCCLLLVISSVIMTILISSPKRCIISNFAKSYSFVSPVKHIC